MQSSVRAVEAYRRSRLIDGVTSDEDKVAPVYRFEEICQVLRNSPSDVSREMLEHALKRLDHKSPIVKQKTLRFLKYASGKGGSNFKRDLQRQAGVIRSLCHYKGQLDALKGDALNKAVRDTADDTISAIFDSEEKPTTMKDVGRRIEGFGSTNFVSQRDEDKKSVLGDLAGFGSQSLKQSIDMLNNFSQYSGSGSGPGLGGSRNSVSRTYRSQGLRRSLTAEREMLEKEESESCIFKDAESNDVRQGPFPKVTTYSKPEVSNGKDVHKDRRGHNSAEDRLLDDLTAPGGVRLHPTREALQTFTSTAQKLDAANLVNSIETKLKAHNWQVRYKALCLLETLIRERESKVLDSVTAMFEEDANAIVDCLSSPQTSLRDKAKKVLDILGASGKEGHAEDGTESDKSSIVTKPSVADLPDLMDARDVDFNFEPENLQSTSGTPITEQTAPATGSVALAVDQDFFGDWIDAPSTNASLEPAVKESEPDPFAGMSFHSADDAVRNVVEPDFFSGLDFDTNKRVSNGAPKDVGRSDGSSLFHSFPLSQGNKAGVAQGSVMDLFASLSTSNGALPGTHKVPDQLQNLSSTSPFVQQSFAAFPSTGFTGDMNQTKVFTVQQHLNEGQPGVVPGRGQTTPNFFPPGGLFMNGFPAGIPNQLPPNLISQQSSQSAATNFTGVNGPFAPSFPDVHRYGQNVHTNTANGKGASQNRSDDFDFSGDPMPTYGKGAAENSKNEDTKAFDFIMDHISLQLGPKKSS